MGPGDFQIICPPGIEIFDLEASPSGHLVLPISEYKALDKSLSERTSERHTQQILHTNMNDTNNPEVSGVRGVSTPPLAFQAGVLEPPLDPAFDYLLAQGQRTYHWQALTWTMVTASVELFPMPKPSNQRFASL